MLYRLYIYLHLPQNTSKIGSKYTSPMDPLGIRLFFRWSFSKYNAPQITQILATPKIRPLRAAWRKAKKKTNTGKIRVEEVGNT